MTLQLSWTSFENVVAIDSAPFPRNIGGKRIAANIYENLSSIFLKNSFPYIKLPVGL